MNETTAPLPSDSEADPKLPKSTGTEDGVPIPAAKTESQDSSSDEIEFIPTDVQPTRKRKSVQQRRNIKEILGQDKLDERTLAAQREEWARRERMAAKHQNLRKKTRLPLSMEQIMERFSNKSLVSMTPVTPDSELVSTLEDRDKTKFTASNNTHQSVEHEVLTLSSDDEEPAPTLSISDLRARIEPQFPTSYPYGSFVSDTVRSRYSGGTMIVPSGDPDLDASVIALNDESESRAVKREEDEDDDDCVVLSPGAEEEEYEKDEDELNVPDEFGRILINVGHPPEDPDIFLAPKIAKTIKPHQVSLSRL